MKLKFAVLRISQRFVQECVAEFDEFREFIAGWPPERGQRFAVSIPILSAMPRPPYASEKPFMCFHSRGMTEHMQGPTGLRKPGLNRPLLSQQDHRTISALTVLFGNLALGLR